MNPFSGKTHEQPGAQCTLRGHTPLFPEMLQSLDWAPARGSPHPKYSQEACSSQRPATQLGRVLCKSFSLLFGSPCRPLPIKCLMSQCPRGLAQELGRAEPWVTQPHGRDGQSCPSCRRQHLFHLACTLLRVTAESWLTDLPSTMDRQREGLELFASFCQTTRSVLNLFPEQMALTRPLRADGL